DILPSSATICQSDVFGTYTRPKDFPIPDDAQNVEFRENAKTVHFKSASSIRNLMDFYRKELSSRGWSEDQKQRILAVRDTGLSRFKKAKASLTISMKRLRDVSEVTIICRGVEWK